MAGTITVSTLNNDTGVLATQNGMTGIAKAWVNFNGSGTVAIRDSFNVSSITDNGTGYYTVNFTTAMPNANFATLLSTSSLGTATFGVFSNITGTTTATVLPTTTTTTVFTGYTSGQFDQAHVSVAVFSS
jgi:hypothetical protein